MKASAFALIIPLLFALPSRAQTASELHETFSQSLAPTIKALRFEKHWSCTEIRWSAGGYHMTGSDVKSFEFYPSADAINHRYYNRGSNTASRFYFMDQGFLALPPDGVAPGHSVLARITAKGELLVEHQALALIERAGVIKSSIDPELDVLGYSLCSQSGMAIDPTAQKASNTSYRTPGLDMDARGNLDSPMYIAAFGDLFESPASHAELWLSTLEIAPDETEDSVRRIDAVQQNCLAKQIVELAKTDAGAGPLKSLIAADRAARASETTRPLHQPVVLSIWLNDYRNYKRKKPQAWMDVTVPKCAKTLARVKITAIIDQDGECEIITEDQISAEIVATLDSVPERYSRLRACKEPRL